LVETLVKKSSSERLISNEFGQERVAQMGQLAIKSEQLGINDPLTHLYQYLERGEDALAGIKEDVETDIAERLPKTPFVNQVGFEFSGDDFVSIKDGVSMRVMTENNLHILNAEQSPSDQIPSAELTRAEVEVKEADKLSSWFVSAPNGAFLVFESLPIGKQKVAVSRIYQKTGGQSLIGGFVSLYNPSVDVFNNFRKYIGGGKSDCKTELEVLENNYEINDDSIELSMDQFVEKYVGDYDQLFEDKTGKTYSFGNIENGGVVVDNGLEKVRSQPRLTSIYIDAVRALGNGQGTMTHELMDINQKLGLGIVFKQGDRVSAQAARNVLSEVIRGITSAIDRADVDLLFDIERPDSSSGAGYAVVSHYGSEARREGISYESEACPESSFSTQTKNGDKSESDILQNIFNPGNYPPNFGERKLAICKTRNCPTRKKPFVTVGGCGFCLSCHCILEKNDKSPEKVYSEEWKKEVEQEIAKKKKAEKRLLQEKETAEYIKKQKDIQNKQKFMQKMNQRKKSEQKTFFQEIEEIGNKAA
jgi:hypothetical protein